MTRASQWQDVPTEDCWAWLEELPGKVGPVEVRLVTIQTFAGDVRPIWCWYDRNIQVLAWIEITSRVCPLAARPRATPNTVDEPPPIGDTAPQ